MQRAGRGSLLRQLPADPPQLCACVQILVKGRELPRSTEQFYFALNKPKGYLCANAPGKDGTSRLAIDLFQAWGHPTRQDASAIAQCSRVLHVRPAQPQSP